MVLYVSKCPCRQQLPCQLKHHNHHRHHPHQHDDGQFKWNEGEEQVGEGGIAWWRPGLVWYRPLIQLLPLCVFSGFERHHIFRYSLYYRLWYNYHCVFSLVLNVIIMSNTDPWYSRYQLCFLLFSTSSHFHIQTPIKLPFVFSLGFHVIIFVYVYKPFLLYMITICVV